MTRFLGTQGSMRSKGIHPKIPPMGDLFIPSTRFQVKNDVSVECSINSAVVVKEADDFKFGSNLTALCAQDYVDVVIFPVLRRLLSKINAK